MKEVKMEKTEMPSNKTTLSYKAMMSSKKLSSFSEETEEEE